MRAEGSPYRPANGTEAAAFDKSWCEHCLYDAEFRRGEGCGCELLALASAYGGPPHWQYRLGEPVCTAFVEDRAHPLRCPLTMEMGL